MTESNDVVKVYKIEADRVEMGLAEFIELCNALRDAKETEKANVWLQDARKKLLDEIEYTRKNVETRAPTQITVYRRAPNGSLMVQFIEAMQQGQDGSIYVTIGEPD